MGSIRENTVTKLLTPVRSPTSFKSRIPQKIDETNHEIKTPTSPKTGSFQSKIPRSRSFKQSSVKNETEVLVQRQISEPLAKASEEEKCYSAEQLQSKIPRNVTIKANFECINGNTQQSVANEISYTTGECSAQHPRVPVRNDAISERKYEVVLEENSATTPESSLQHSFSSEETTILNGNNLDIPLFNNLNSAKEADLSPDRNKTPTLEHRAHSDIYQEHSPITNEKDLHSISKDPFKDFMENPESIGARSSTPNTSPKTTTNEKVNDSKCPKPEDEEDLGDNFEKTERDNNDYSTVTTTEYEKDGKVIKTTEVINYSNDRNVKTIVTTSERVVTIPIGQKLDLNSPEITSSTTVRSKYLQTMLQNREFEGDKEVNAETLETIETDFQTDKIDSNDNTDDPDLDTILIILETLDDVRKCEPKVKKFSGMSSDDPTYLDLFTVLNNSLSKFEKIDPKGRTNVEEKRKNGIEYIQNQILLLNTKLRENQPEQAKRDSDNVKPAEDDQNKQNVAQIAEPTLPKLENTSTSSAQKPESKEVQSESIPKKEKRKSTLRRHFKLDKKDKIVGEQGKEKKKKKLCVIS